MARVRMAPLQGIARLALHPESTATGNQVRDAIHHRGQLRLDRKPTVGNATEREISTSEAASYYRVHRSTIVRRLRAGKLRGRRHGWFWRVLVPIASGLTQLQKAVLDFAAHRAPKLPKDGTLYLLLRNELGLSPTRYAQVLAHLLADPTQALRYDGPGVMQLLRVRDAAAAKRGATGRRRLAAV